MPFCYTIKEVKTKSSISWGEIKSIFCNLLRAFYCQKLSQTWECTFRTKTDWTKCMFCQNDKSEKIITPTESNKQGTSKNTFQHIQEDLWKFQEAGFRDVNFEDFARMMRHLQILAVSITLNFTKHVQIALTIIILSNWIRTHQLYVKLQTIPKKLQLDHHLVVPIFIQHVLSVIKVIDTWELQRPVTLIDVSVKVLFC